MTWGLNLFTFSHVTTSIVSGGLVGIPVCCSTVPPKLAEASLVCRTERDKCLPPDEAIDYATNICTCVQDSHYVFSKNRDAGPGWSIPAKSTFQPIMVD